MEGLEFLDEGERLDEIAGGGAGGGGDGGWQVGGNGLQAEGELEELMKMWDL